MLFWSAVNVFSHGLVCLPEETVEAVQVGHEGSHSQLRIYRGLGEAVHHHSPTKMTCRTRGVILKTPALHM